MALGVRASQLEDVNYVVTGSGDQTVVLLHGFSDNLTTWQRVVPPLAVDHRVIAIDLPGFGLTRRAWPTPLLGGYVDVVREVLAAEGVEEPVSLVGNSMGAVVAAMFAATHPALTARVVLIDMPGLRHVPRLWQLATSRPAEVWLRTALHLVPGSLARSGFSLAYRFVASASPSRLDPDTCNGFAAPYLAAGKLAALLPLGRTLVAELGAAGLDALVGDLDAPVLLVFGARDLLTPARVLRRLDRSGGTVVLPGCGHCPQIDRPAALLSQLVPFLHGQQPDAAQLARTA